MAVVELCVKLFGMSVVLKSLFFFAFKKGSIKLNSPQVLSQHMGLLTCRGEISWFSNSFQSADKSVTFLLF